MFLQGSIATSKLFTKIVLRASLRYIAGKFDQYQVGIRGHRENASNQF